MVHHKNQSKKVPKLTPLIAASVVVVSGILSPMAARADQFDAQIKALEQQRAQSQAAATSLGQQALGIQGEIDVLRNQIASIQAQIDTNTARQNDLTAQIDAAQKKLEDQKSMLSANIRSMYIEGDISPLEMIASSKNLGDFVDKQEYRDRIKDSISTTMDEIEALKKQLDEQKREITRILDEQKTLRGTLDQKNNEAGAKLASVNQDKAAFDEQVRSQSAQIASMRAQQAAAMQRVFGGSTSASGSYGSLRYRNLAGNTSACGGGYPSHYCNAAQDTIVDEWDLWNRECVSYAAWAMRYRFGHMVPEFNGSGNAYLWTSTVPSRGYGYVTDVPTKGSVLVIPTAMIGGVGHVAVVEEVYGDGWFRVSQYNWSRYIDGKYSTMDVQYTPGLKFIIFTQ